MQLYWEVDSMEIRTVSSPINVGLLEFPGLSDGLRGVLELLAANWSVLWGMGCI